MLAGLQSWESLAWQTFLTRAAAVGKSAPPLAASSAASSAASYSHFAAPPHLAIGLLVARALPPILIAKLRAPAARAVKLALGGGPLRRAARMSSKALGAAAGGAAGLAAASSGSAGGAIAVAPRVIRLAKSALRLGMAPLPTNVASLVVLLAAAAAAGAAAQRSTAEGGEPFAFDACVPGLSPQSSCSGGASVYRAAPPPTPLLLPALALVAAAAAAWLLLQRGLPSSCALRVIGVEGGGVAGGGGNVAEVGGGASGGGGAEDGRGDLGCELVSTPPVGRGRRGGEAGRGEPADEEAQNAGGAPRCVNSLSDSFFK